jgi:thiosulfate/3-mercaptopyruvate sulfurtransferase
VVRPCPNLFIDKHDVLTSINDKNKSIINALKPQEHSGTIKRYARPGHIPFSVNVPAQAILDPEFHTYLSAEQLLEKFEEVEALGRDQVIIYCGGGIAATSVAFALHLLGVKNVVVYDGSLFEWAADRNLPMEVG